MSFLSVFYVTVLFLCPFFLTSTTAIPITETPEALHTLKTRGELPPGFREQVCFGDGADNGFFKARVEVCRKLRDELVDRQRGSTDEETGGISHALEVLATKDNFKYRPSDNGIITSFGGQLRTEDLTTNTLCLVEVIGQYQEGQSPLPQIV